MQYLYFYAIAIKYCFCFFSSWDPPPLWGLELSDEEDNDSLPDAAAASLAGAKKKKRALKMVPQGICDICEKNDALRLCIQCNLDYCLTCYIERHKSAKASTHTFSLIEEQEKTFKCIECRVKVMSLCIYT
jgi:hypothetical protein